MQTVDDYLAMPYHVTVVPDRWDDGTEGWFAEVEEFDGCWSQGRSPDEAVERVRDAMRAWIVVMLEQGREIPLPRDDATDALDREAVARWLWEGGGAGR